MLFAGMSHFIMATIQMVWAEANKSVLEVESNPYKLPYY